VSTDVIEVTWFKKSGVIRGIVHLSPVNLAESEEIPRSSVLGSLDAYTKSSRNSGATLTLDQWTEVLALALRTSSRIELGDCDLPLPVLTAPETNVQTLPNYEQLSLEDKSSNFSDHCNLITTVVKRVRTFFKIQRLSILCFSRFGHHTKRLATKLFL
jgi:hypothetical protein